MDTLSTAEALLGDLNGFQAFQREGAGLGEELRDYQKEQFDSWCRAIQTALHHPSQPLG